MSVVHEMEAFRDECSSVFFFRVHDGGGGAVRFYPTALSTLALLACVVAMVFSVKSFQDRLHILRHAIRFPTIVKIGLVSNIRTMGP